MQQMAINWATIECIQKVLNKFTVIGLLEVTNTFQKPLKVLKERYPNSKFIIIVCHAVNDKGLINMCNNFDQVIVSNSHRDINYRPSNENLTVIDVCK